MDKTLNITMTFDSGFTMPAAVTIRSAIENTPGRISVYIIDCGISDADKDRLQQSLPTQRAQDVTLSFLALPSGSLAESQGPAWGIIDMFSILMVEKVLYLDADTLVRGDLWELWDTDMVGKPLAAARDLSFPMGHDAVGKGSPYFNSGVLLLHLERIRAMIAKESIRPLAVAMRTHILMDQDPLNVYFKDNWLEIPLKWNAHGLGTLANMYSPERSLLDLSEMKTKPLIVHFTGTVHPSMEFVLYEWFPLTSKPWGYAGAPNNPFEGAWWEVLEKTAWKGVKETKDYQDLLERKKIAAVEKGIAEFHRKLTAYAKGPKSTQSERLNKQLTGGPSLEVR